MEGKSEKILSTKNSRRKERDVQDYKKKKYIWLGYVLKRECLLKTATEGKVKEKRRESRRKQTKHIRIAENAKEQSEWHETERFGRRLH